jgi:hypothetical protein
VDVDIPLAAGVQDEPVVVQFADPVVMKIDLGPSEIEVVGVMELAVMNDCAGITEAGNEQAPRTDAFMP